MWPTHVCVWKTIFVLNSRICWIYVSLMILWRLPKRRTNLWTWLTCWWNVWKKLVYAWTLRNGTCCRWACANFRLLGCMLSLGGSKVSTLETDFHLQVQHGHSMQTGAFYAITMCQSANIRLIFMQVCHQLHVLRQATNQSIRSSWRDSTYNFANLYVLLLDRHQISTGVCHGRPSNMNGTLESKFMWINPASLPGRDFVRLDATWCNVCWTTHFTRESKFEVFADTKTWAVGWWAVFRNDFIHVCCCHGW